MGGSDLQCGQHGGLVAVDGGDTSDRHPLVDRDALALNPPQLYQDSLGRCTVAGSLEALVITRCRIKAMKQMLA